MFVVIGERINTSRSAVQEAVANRDAGYVAEDVKQQAEAGAAYIDVNAGARIGHEAEDMRWLLEVIQGAVDLPLTLDSPDPAVLEMAYELARREPMINSISLETERWEQMAPFLEGKACSVIALCMDDTGLPADSDEIVSRAKLLSAGLEELGIPREKTFIDPLVQPISTDQTKGVMVLDALARMNRELPGIKSTCGLSNISYGLPKRKIINRHFLTLMMGAGLTSAIIDPLDVQIMASIRTSDMLLGNDEYCGDYLQAVRAGQIEG